MANFWIALDKFPVTFDENIESVSMIISVNGTVEDEVTLTESGEFDINCDNSTDYIKLTITPKSGYKLSSLVLGTPTGAWTAEQNDNVVMIYPAEDNTGTTLSINIISAPISTETPEYTLRIDGTEVTDYENVIVNGTSYKCKKASAEIPTVPTDLTGYTVSVPSGWSASSGYGQFNINYDVTYTDSSSYSQSSSLLSIGYSGDFSQQTIPRENAVSFEDDGRDISMVTSSSTLVFVINGGTDVTNSDLIQWFASNGATFRVNHGGSTN